ncbi:MAG: hypothetical protein GX542_05925 [Rhodococcus sp.]|nr:hypothetical protein [Rhodococcus sp. (in: high G+C Gram-positive bacteria)]
MDRGRWIGALAASAIVALVLILGVTAPTSHQRSFATTDTLGPDGGEDIATYLGRARESLAERSASDGDLWALVSFHDQIRSDEIRGVVGDVRVSELRYRLQLDRVQTPVVDVQVADGDAALAAADGHAISKVQQLAGFDQRQDAIHEAMVRGLNEQCACIVGVIVRGTVDELEEIANQAQVRAVEALPPDAIHGWFAVRPLLPEYVDVAVVGPDDGDVPR